MMPLVSMKMELLVTIGLEVRIAYVRPVSPTTVQVGI